MIAHSLLIPIAYLLGSINFAILVCRWRGLPDPRGLGSGNPGATNVLRTGHKAAAFITLLGDMLKGLVPVGVAAWLRADERWLAMVAIAAFLGHLYPIYYGFKGGKGVATALGVLLGMDWMVGLLALAVWLAVFAFSRISSLSALAAALAAPSFMWYLHGPGWPSACAVFIAALLLLRHRANILKLVRGEEKAFRKSSAG